MTIADVKIKTAHIHAQSIATRIKTVVKHKNVIQDTHEQNSIFGLRILVHKPYTVVDVNVFRLNVGHKDDRIVTLFVSKGTAKKMLPSTGSFPSIKICQTRKTATRRISTLPSKNRDGTRVKGTFLGSRRRQLAPFQTSAFQADVVFWRVKTFGRESQVRRRRRRTRDS